MKEMWTNVEYRYKQVQSNTKIKIVWKGIKPWHTNKINALIWKRYIKYNETSDYYREMVHNYKFSFEL